jgi:subtilisin family serine protease
MIVVPLPVISMAFRIALAVLLAATSASAQTYTSRSTLCQATPVAVIGEVTDRRLVGCGQGFPDNLLWHLDRSDSVGGELDGRVQYGLTGKGAVVYVVDTGMRADHVEFIRATGNRIIAGLAPFDTPNARCPEPATAPCWENQPSLLILLSHGTAVASMIAGANSGIAPDANIVSLLGPLQGSTWARGIQAIVTHAFAPASPPFKTAIVNISGGVAGVSTEGLAEIEATIRKMTAGIDANGNPDPNGKRFLFVAAAGNTGQCSDTGGVALIPGTLGTSIDGLITVGGLSRTNTVWDGACKGPLVEVIAPADTLFLASTAARDLYRSEPAFYISGTSYSTPYVSAMAARLLELDPNLTPAQLESRIKDSPSHVGGYPVPVMTVTTTEPTQKRRSAKH